MAAIFIAVRLFLPLELAHLVPALLLAGALLIGALVAACVRRWQRSNRPLSPSASEQLAEFRSLYEKGQISEEEYRRLRGVLGGEIRRSSNLPAHQAKTSNEAVQP